MMCTKGSDNGTGAPQPKKKPWFLAATGVLPKTQTKSRTSHRRASSGCERRSSHRGRCRLNGRLERNQLKSAQDPPNTLTSLVHRLVYCGGVSF
jgi:hypothetical protein